MAGNHLHSQFGINYLESFRSFSSTMIQRTRRPIWSWRLRSLHPLNVGICTRLQGLVYVRIGFKGFEKRQNSTHGELEMEAKPRLFFVQSTFPVRAFCQRTDRSQFYSPSILSLCRLLALVAASVVSLAFLPAIYAFLHSSWAERDVIALSQVQDIVRSICNSVKLVRLMTVVLSYCSAFVSRVRPEISRALQPPSCKADGIMTMEPYCAAVACYNLSRSESIEKRIPGWLLTLEGFRVAFQGNAFYFVNTLPAKRIETLANCVRRSRHDPPKTLDSMDDR